MMSVPRFSRFFSKVSNSFVRNISPNNCPLGILKKPATRLTKSRTLMKFKKPSVFHVLFDNFRKRAMKMIAVIINSAFIKYKKSFNITSFEHDDFSNIFHQCLCSRCNEVIQPKWRDADDDNPNDQ